MSSLFEWNNEAHNALLARLKANLPQLEALQQDMAEAEESALLRFYRSDPRVYDLRRQIQKATILFRNIAVEGELALPFEVIFQGATGGHLDFSSARLWILSTMPVITAFYHCRYFVDQHVRFGQELERPPDVPTSGWVALLCLYSLQ